MKARQAALPLFVTTLIAKVALVFANRGRFDLVAAILAEEFHQTLPSATFALGDFNDF